MATVTSTESWMLPSIASSASPSGSSDAAPRRRLREPRRRHAAPAREPLMPTIGYARVSTQDQNLSLQLDALKAAGCERVYTDRASGARDDRPGLALALAVLHPGDVLTVYKLDRLGRSLRHLVETVAGLERKGVGLRV